MILGPVSYLDCIVFCVFLAPQLLIHVGILETAAVVLRCLPFLCASFLRCILSAAEEEGGKCDLLTLRTPDQYSSCHMSSCATGSSQGARTRRRSCGGRRPSRTSSSAACGTRSRTYRPGSGAYSSLGRWPCRFSGFGCCATAT